MKIFNNITAGKYSYTIGILAELTRMFPGEKFKLVYSDGNTLDVNISKYDYKSICGFDNQHPKYRLIRPIGVQIEGREDIAIRYKATINTPCVAGKVSNKFGVFIPECYDLGRTRVTGKNVGNLSADFCRTFANYITVVEDEHYVIYGGLLRKPVLSTPFGDIALDDDGDQNVAPVLDASDDNNNFVFDFPDGTRLPVTLPQEFKHNGIPVAAKTIGGLICYATLLDARDAGAKLDFDLSFISGGVIPLTARKDEKLDATRYHNFNLELLYEKVKSGVEGNQILNKLRTLAVYHDERELGIILRKDDKNAVYDIYTELGVSTNTSCAALAAAACFYYNTKINRSLSPVSGIFFSFVGICWSKGYAESYNDNGNTRVQLVRAGFDALATDKTAQDGNDVYFSGDLDANTALYYRVFRDPIAFKSFCILRVPNRKHYVCAKLESTSSDGTNLVHYDAIQGDATIAGTRIPFVDDPTNSRFSGIRASYDGEIMVEAKLTRRNPEIAFSLGGQYNA